MIIKKIKLTFNYFIIISKKSLRIRIELNVYIYPILSIYLLSIQFHFFLNTNFRSNRYTSNNKNSNKTPR